MKAITQKTLATIGFTASADKLPIFGAPIIGYHQVFGFAHGYYGGRECGFILPAHPVANRGYNWVTHWRYEGNEGA